MIQCPLARRVEKTRVLIVDDQMIARNQVRLLLEDERDLEIDEAASGREAIERVLERKPPVVLMDITMPEMNGIVATAEIKRLLPATRVIALTIHDNPEYRKAMFNAGAQAYVLKEDLPDELIELIRGGSDIPLGENVHET